MKKLYLLFVLCVSVLLSNTCLAQQEIWGTILNGGKYGYGCLYKTDSVSNNLVIVHHFDSLQGKTPGRIMQASNGKLYGLTVYGGTGAIHVPGGADWQFMDGGTLFEYDIVTSTFRLLVNFSYFNPSLPYETPDAAWGLIEISPGILYGQFYKGGTIPAAGGTIFKYDIAANTTSVVLKIPDFRGGTWNDTQHNSLTGQLFKASDGMLYAGTARNSTCPIGSPNMGSVIRINPANNSYSVMYLNPCNLLQGAGYQSYFIEESGNLYSVAGGGSFNSGVIYQYNLSTKAVTPKYSFTGDTFGWNPSPMIKAGNGNWYGTADGGTPYINQQYGSGIIYEYDPVANDVKIKHEFRYHNIYGLPQRTYGSNLMKGVNGKLYGTAQEGIFVYDAEKDTFTTGASFPFTTTGYSSVPGPLLSICKKPVFVNDTTKSFNVCEGSYFYRNVRSANATSIVWKHNGFADVTRATGILEFESVELANEGTWVCELTNECGTTLTPAITITVNAKGGASIITSAISLDGINPICPGSSIKLQGNNGGKWNTGPATPFIIVNTPGDYQVVNNNTCGNTYSNVIHLDTLASPVAPVITFLKDPGPDYGPVLFKATCPRDSLLLTGNTNGIWNTGETADSIYVTDTFPRYVVTSNRCSNDTSAIAKMSYYYNLPLKPVVIVEGSPFICVGDSVYLTTNRSEVYNWYREYEYFGNTYFTYVDYGTGIKAYEEGKYFVSIYTSCGSVNSDSVSVTLSEPIDTAYITADGPTVFCEGDSVTLTSNSAISVWNTGVTAQQIKVRASGPYFTTLTNSCSSKTSDVIYATVVPPPVIAYIQEPSLVCITADTIRLSVATPAGGVYSGDDIINDTLFYPAAAGEGEHHIQYTFTNGLGCTNHADQYIYVGTPWLPVISQTGNVLMCTASGGSYQWYLNDDEITGATSQSYTPLQNGIYKVAMVNVFGCDSISEPFNFISSGTGNIETGEAISVYPNPTEGSFYIKLTDDVKELSIVNALGQTIQTEHNFTNSIMPFMLYENGVYFIKATTGAGVITKRIVVCH